MVGGTETRSVVYEVSETWYSAVELVSQIADSAERWFHDCCALDPTYATMQRRDAAWRPRSKRPAHGSRAVPRPPARQAPNL